MNVPFVDLGIQYRGIKSEIDSAITNVINESAFIKGKYVNDFEKEFAAAYEVKNCIGVANGTDALYILLKMHNIGYGDEVITTALSWISTSETISQVGAKPVFVDVDSYYTINVNEIEKKITNKTRAIIPVHLYGQPCQIDSIVELSNRYHLELIEDCAQSHFSEFNGKKVGTFGKAASFSFYPGKNLGAYGDAGAIITDDDLLAQRCRMYANHGALTKHHHMMEGINSRLDGLQAAILSVKLKYIHQWNLARLEKAMYYNERLKKIPFVITPKIRYNVKHIFHVYCIQASYRDDLRAYLSKNGIETQIHYPTMLPFMPAYKYLQYSFTEFPVAYSLQDKILSLPLYPEISLDQMNVVIESIEEFYHRNKI